MPDTQHLVPELPEARTIELAECRLAYFTLGERSGTPLVLCHGLAATGLQFVRDAEWFASLGFYVIVPDIRGHGRSQVQQPVQQTWFNVPVLANDMLAILDAEELASVHWVGNSLGGIIGLDIMGSYPQRLLSFASFGTSYRLGVPHFAVVFSSLFARLVGKDILASILAPMTCREAEGQAVIAAMLKQTDIEAAVAIGREVRSYDLIDNALQFERPILMLKCALDRQVNGALHTTLNAMKAQSNFTLIDVEDAGHCANLDQPEIIRRHVLDFVKTHVAGRDGAKPVLT